MKTLYDFYVDGFSSGAHRLAYIPDDMHSAQRKAFELGYGGGKKSSSYKSYEKSYDEFAQAMAGREY